MEGVRVQTIKRHRSSSHRRKKNPRTALVNVARVRPVLSEPSHPMQRAGTTRKLYQVRQMDVIQQPDGIRQVDMTLQFDATRQDIADNMTVEDLTNGTKTNTNPSPVQSEGIRVMQNSSQNENELVDLHPRTITPTKYKHISSFDVPSSPSSISPFHSISRMETASILLKQNPILSFNEIALTNKHDKYKWKRLFHISGFFSTMDTPEISNVQKKEREKRQRHRRRLCGFYPFCCNCCCAWLTLALMLLLVGLACLLVALLGHKGTTTTTTTTTTTSTTSTTTTTTSTTSTTTTTTSTTSATTTTTTTTATTTTATTTTTETTTTQTTTTTTTPLPPCTPVNAGSSSTLLSISSVSITGYICYCYEWTAPTTGTVTLAFQIRNDPSTSYLDDVNVYAGGTQLLVNGGFETGSLSPWVSSHPNGNCGFGSLLGQVCTSSPHSGSYGYCDGCNTVADELSQSFMATAGQVYVVSFWLATGATGSVISALVTLQ